MTTETSKQIRLRVLEALRQGRWAEARALLDDLSRRTDVDESVPALATFDAAERLQGSYRTILQDRIDLVNCIADRGDL